jgi:pimeloyl-ACP methyl ester carboxylesterase
MTELLKHLRLWRPALFFCLAALSASGCVPSAKTPMPTISFDQERSPQHPLLLVFLPGRGDAGASFATEGFVDSVRRAGVQADIMAVDAHLGYYLEHKLLQRLKEDVIVPAKQQGYRQIWLVGISLGGFGALWYDIENPGDLAGVVVLAPYLGEPEIIGEVSRAGGLAAWNPPQDGVIDDQHKIWRGLKTYVQREKSGNRLFLGYGLQDRFAEADGLLAAVLPSDQVYSTAGGHDWPTWRALWDGMLQNLTFAGEWEGSTTRK